jgi:GntR family transcriptional regulator
LRKISKDNPLPLHYQIKEILQEMIENEELKPGDAIYTERELCEIQGVSRMTVNKAIMSLVNEGILYRQQGRGTFVARPKVNQQLSKLKGFTEEMQDKGFKSDTRLLNFQVKKATKQNKIILKLPDSEDMVIEINRLRMSNGEPVAIETAWIPYYMFRDMTREMIDGQSLYEVFREKYKCFPSKAKQTIEPTKVNDYEADLIGLKNESLALLFRRTTFDEKERPIEYTKSIYRSDNYRYEVILT